MLAFEIVSLNYVSAYVQDYETAVSFYTQVFGPPQVAEVKAGIHGWPMGNTWLTLFPSSQGTHPESNPRNLEFAIQVAEPAQVDALHAALVAAGATSCWNPEDTEMYEPMRFAAVDDPFGVRIDVYCPIAAAKDD